MFSKQAKRKESNENKGLIDQFFSSLKDTKYRKKSFFTLLWADWMPKKEVKSSTSFSFSAFLSIFGFLA